MKNNISVRKQLGEFAVSTDIAPMLATLVDATPEGNDWLFEVKWDGFRALAYTNKGEVQLKSRNNKSFNEKFYPIFKAFEKWGDDVILDGEIIVVNEQGFPDFAALQTWRSEADGELVYYAFDILFYNGEELIHRPLIERRAILEHILPQEGSIRLSSNFPVSGADFFAIAERMGLEGIVAKHKDSKYSPGIRSKQWLKIKTVKHQEAVIAGYTRNETSSRKFSALLLGVYEGNILKFIGPVGTGFTNAVQEEIATLLKPLETNTCPFEEVPEYNKPSRFRPNPPKAEVVWVRPELVAEISYRTVAPDGSLRHPSFKTLREDKQAKEIVHEKALPVSLTLDDTDDWKKKITTERRIKDRQTLLNPTNESQVREIGGRSLKFTNLGKMFWPEDGVSKRDVINYYYQVAPYILPYLEKRPQTLNRFPNGIHGESFYQKDVTGKVPDWIETYRYYSEADQKEKQFLIVSDEASLLYVASLGCIEINPWSSTAEHPGNPDWCIIDLDPDQNTFDQVIEAAMVTKQLLDSIGVPSYCKTSGSTGLHIYIPLGGKYGYEDSKEFGRALVKIIHSELPAYTSIERIKANRKGKMYLDFLQNRPQATVAAPYSLRPKVGATVSMPLHWEEVKVGLSIQQFHIRNAMDRIKEQGDIFKGVLETGIDLHEAIEKLSQLY